MPEGRLQKLVDVYLRGREQSTRKSYESSFRGLGKLCGGCELSVFGLDEEARCQLWLEAIPDYYGMRVSYVGTCSEYWVRLDNGDVQLELDPPWWEYAG